MKIFKKKWVMILLAVMVVFVTIIHIAWFRTFHSYKDYAEGMEKFKKFNYPSYHFYGDDGYTYVTKKPSYLTFVGNLTVTNSTDTVSLIIWPPRPGHDYEYGLMITDDEVTGEQVYVDRNMKALDDEYQPLLDKHQEEIEEVYGKAVERWGEFGE